MPTFFTEVFNDASPVAPLGLIVLEGAKDLGKKVDDYLVKWYNQDVGNRNPRVKKKSFI